MVSIPYPSVKKSLRTHADVLFCRDGTVVNESTCLPPMWPRFNSQIGGVKCGLSLLALYSAPRGFLRELRFPLSSKKQNLTSLCQLLISVAVSSISAPALERLDNGKAKAKGLVIDASNVGILSRRKLPHSCTNVKEKINSFMLHRTWTCHSNTWPHNLLNRRSILIAQGKMGNTFPKASNVRILTETSL